MIGLIYTHKKKKTKYTVISNTVSFKFGDYWEHNCILYHQVNHPDVLYCRQYDDFMNSFELE